MSHINDTDPQKRPEQYDADILAAQCHAIIETLRRKRLAGKLLIAALDGLRLVAAYKDPVEAPSRKPNQRGQPPIVVGDLLRE
ncbi:hypothetical protein [Leptolyngbya sp. FACHB-8]|uniref:hypothetical protein n=1 Tax=unclassified Leptolyngbya TaxID=2650499 RepID=UPI001687A0A0|nr:hypothetical protein [Leptolyngbya sp. FACHB-8]MBD1911272.1 hypothetical protein [Leptolyngbya sp. FACHB-8]